MNGTTTVSKTVDGGSIPSAPAIAKIKRLVQAGLFFNLNFTYAYHMHYFGIFKDTQFPFRGFTHSRNIVRGLIQRGDGRFIFTYIFHEDRFGLRDYLETPGGGVETGESLEVALMREIQEECGLTIHAIQPLGIVEDAYNLIQRHNINHYFYAKMSGMVEKKWTEGEQRLIKDMPWLTLEEAIVRYEALPDKGIAFLIKQRELQVLYYLRQQLPKIV